MDEKYLQDLYEWIKENDSSYEGRYNYNQFKQKMQDENYASQMHQWISDIDNTFEQRRPLNNFLELVKSPAAQQQPLVKKKEPTVSSSEDGWSEFLGSKKYKPQQESKPATPVLSEDESSEAWKKKVKREPEAFDFGMSKYVIPDNIKPGHGVLLPEKKYPLTFLGRRSQEQIEEEVPGFIKPIINKIDVDFLKQGHLIVKKELTYYLDDAGFETKVLDSYDTGSGVDMISITAPDGEVRQFQIFSNLDKEAEKIKQFIKEKSNLVSDKEYWYQNQYKKFKSKEDIENEVKTISNQEKIFHDEYKQYLNMERDIKELKADLKRWEDFKEQNTPKYIQTSAYLAEKEKEFNEYAANMRNKAVTLQDQQKQLQKAAGKYFELQSEKGTFAGAMYRGFMDSTANIITQLTRLAYGATIDLLPMNTLYSQEVYENAYRQKLLEEGIIKRIDEPLEGKVMDAKKQAEIRQKVDAELRDKFKKAGITGRYEDGEEIVGAISIEGMRKTMSDFLNMPTSTTAEYKQKIEEEGSIVQRGLLGLSGSIPAMIGGPLSRVAKMYLMTTDAAVREMDNDPSFANVSENEKQLVAAPIGVIGAALEEIGFRNLIKGSSVSTNIIRTVLGRVPSNASASVIRKTTLDVVAEMGIKGTTALVGATLAEAETGAAQQFSEYAVKDVYNYYVRGEKMFDNPEMSFSFDSQYLKDITDAAATEAVGGLTMGVPYSISAAFKKDGFQALDDETFKIFEELSKDADSRKFFVTSLKNKINQGEITPTQSKEILESYDKASGMIAQVPDEITDPKTRKVVMDMMIERKRLEDKIQGKDSALAKPIQNKINQINEQLSKLTEDAIQKQAAGEVSLQPEAETGQEMEAGGPEAGPQITPEQGVLSPEEKEKLTQNRRVDLFPEESEFADVIGGSGTNSTLSDYNEVNGIGIASYTNPDNGLVDVIMSGTSDNDYVGYVRVYENGKPTNRWTSKMSNESGNKENFRTMISEVQSRLPENHEYTEKTNISIDGVRVYSNQLNRGYEILTDKNGNPVTNTVTLNAATVQGLQQASTQEEKQSLYDNMVVTTKEQFDALRDKITSLMPNVEVSWDQNNNTVQLQLPVLVQSGKAQIEQAPVTQTAESIEKRRQAELDKLPNGGIVTQGDVITTSKEADEINAKYDAELAALQPTEKAPVTEVTPVTEVAPTEQFTEQDRARKEELTDALAKADKRRKNVIVGETTMTKAEAKAELEALTQKEQAVTEAAPVTEEVAVAEEVMTPEQEADLLEELLTGKKKEPVAEEAVAEEEKAPALASIEATTKALEELDKKKYKQIESGSEDVNMRGVKFSDIFIGDTLLEDLITTLSEEDKRQVKEIFSRGIDYFKFNEAEQKSWENKFVNPEDFNEVFDMLATSGLARESAYQFYNDTNYEYVKDQINYILKNKNEYSKEFIEVVDKINQKLKNPQNSTQRLYAIDIAEFLGFSKSPRQISEAYHKAKADGSNPELVKKVEEFLGKPKGKQGAKGKKLADAVRKNLKIKGPGGLQSNILGIPVAIWNAGVETMAKAIEVGAVVNDAVKKGIDYIREKHGKKFNEEAVEKKLLIGHYKGAIEIAREAKVTNEGLKTYLKRQGLTDAQIEPLLKIKEKTEKKPISKEKAIGKPAPKKVTVNEMTALKDQLRLEAKAAREAKGDLNTKRKMLADAIKNLEKKGRITTRQATALINKVNSVNLDNPVMVERLLDYAEKVFNDAEYADKLRQAKKLQSTAKSLSKNKEKNPEVRELAKKFAEIDPALVENIDEYIEYASQVVEGVKGSKLTAKGVSLAAAVDINETSKYVEKALEQQAEKQKQMMADKMQSLMGVDVSDLTYDQLLQLLDDSSKPIDKYKETIIRDVINKMFDTYSSIIERMLETGKDPFDISEDAETIEFKDSKKEVIKNFMSIDLNSLSPREAIKAVDALNNFIVNGSTANMETVYNTYIANKNAKTVKQKGVKGNKLTFFFVPSLGRILLDEFASLPLLLESMFKSTNVALYFSRMSGLSNLMNGAARATTITQKTISRYLQEFSKLKPNGKAFNDAYNATERGMIAFMSRNIIGSEAAMKKEFNDRKSLVEKSIDELSKGTEKEKEKAKLYQEAYDKILKDSKNAQEVREKAAKENVNAVDWWTNEWSKHFDELSDVSLNVYNKVLDRDLNYTTDRYSKLELGPRDESVLDSNASAYHFNNGTMYKKEAGALKETTDKTGELPKNKDGEVTRYVDLSFDSIQASSLYDAMADIKTAGAIRQVEAFFKSADTRSLFSAEDFKLLTDRINLAIRNIRNQQSYDNVEIEKLVKALDKFAKYSASIALAGVTQPFKQTIPLMFNTLINAGQFDPFGVTFNKAINEFIDESGRAIANRGVESQVYIESINRLIDEAAKSKGEAALKLIEQANDLWMKVFLANPDKYIARASWMAYYEQSLKKQGLYNTTKKVTLPSGETVEILTKGIDYADHKLNEEAADYAQMMVDRQQNITDTKLAGRMYSDTKGGWGKKVLTRMLLPLASFRLNQFIRAKSDTATLFSKTATLQDKKKAGRSLSGMAVEMLVFKSMVIGFGLTWHYISDAILAAITGDEDDEEESEKKWKVRFNNLVKGQATSAVTDLFSPIPIFDPLVKYGANTALDITQDFLNVADEDKFELFIDDPKKVKTYADAAGMYGIALDKINEIFKTSNLAITGKFKDDYGNEKYISEEQRKLLSWSLIPSVVFNAGLLPGAPEFNNITGKITKDIKYSAMTEKQLEVYKKTGMTKEEVKADKEEWKAYKEESLQGYESEKEFKEKAPNLYLKAIKDGSIYEYRERERKRFEEKHEDEPFRGLSEKKFKELYPTEWRKKYGPGTAYFKSQRTPEALKRKAAEKRQKAEIEREQKKAEIKRKIEEAKRKAARKRY